MAKLLFLLALLVPSIPTFAVAGEACTDSNILAGRKALAKVLEAVYEKDYFRLNALVSIRVKEYQRRRRFQLLWGGTEHMKVSKTPAEMHMARKYGTMKTFSNVFADASTPPLAWVRWIERHGQVLKKRLPELLTDESSEDGTLVLTLAHQQRRCSFSFVEAKGMWFLDNVHLSGAPPWMEKGWEVPGGAPRASRSPQQEQPGQHGTLNGGQLYAGMRPVEARRGYWREGSSTAKDCMRDLFSAVEQQDYFRLYMLCSTQVVKSFWYESVTIVQEGDVWDVVGLNVLELLTSPRGIRYGAAAFFERVMQKAASPRVVWVRFVLLNAERLQEGLERDRNELIESEDGRTIRVPLLTRGTRLEIELVKEHGRWFLDKVFFAGVEWPEGDEPVPSPLPPWIELMKPPDERTPADSSSEGRR